MTAPTEIITRDDGVEHLVIQTARLKILRGPDRGRDITVAGRCVVVGTDPDCDLVLSDGSVSRRQFEVRLTPLGFLLTDLESANGTFIGGVRAREVLLPGKARILVGRSEIEFLPLSDREELALSRHHRFGALVAESAVMRRCFSLLEQAAASDSTVLVEGESGTGKELAASALHQKSSCSDGPLVVVDCGAIPTNLIESELFGHEKGAFTGAVESKEGAFEAADNGTLFLDEIGELDLNLQPRLLRFLESREVRRLGSNQTREVDVRVIAATNRPVERMVEEGALRQDLFYRLAVIRCHLPALRERPEDIPLLALELARAIRPEMDPATWLDDYTLAILATHHWPGNVRELRNVLERIAAMPQLDPETLVGNEPGTTSTQGVLVDLPYHEAKQRVLDSFERRYLESVLKREDGVVVRAADKAGVPRQTFFRLIRKHGLRRT